MDFAKTAAAAFRVCMRRRSSPSVQYARTAWDTTLQQQQHQQHQQPHTGDTHRRHSCCCCCCVLLLLLQQNMARKVSLLLQRRGSERCLEKRDSPRAVIYASNKRSQLLCCDMAAGTEGLKGILECLSPRGRGIGQQHTRSRRNKRMCL